MLSNGTIDNKYEGKGPYLFLNGFAYLCPSADGNSFTLKFQSSDSQSPDGSFDGVFYRNGDVFGAGWETPVYDPAEDWGDDWADNRD